MEKQITVTPKSWADDFNPFLSVQQQYDAEQSKIRSRMHALDVTVLTERELSTNQKHQMIIKSVRTHGGSN